MHLLSRRTVALLLVWSSAVGCMGIRRDAGQVEIFGMASDKRLVRLPGPGTNYRSERSLLGTYGDSVRYADDIVTIQVSGAFIERVPATMLGSRDMVLFAEVWENAATGYGAQPLNSVVCVARNQLVPGKMNFTGNLAYGPTNYKGHPLRVKFTLLLLQKESSDRANAAADIVENFVSMAGAGTGAGPWASQAVGVARQLLRSQPDVEAFDFDVTFLSDQPERLEATILDAQAGGRTPAQTSSLIAASGVAEPGGAAAKVDVGKLGAALEEVARGVSAAFDFEVRREASRQAGQLYSAQKAMRYVLDRQLDRTDIADAVRSDLQSIADSVDSFNPDAARRLILNHSAALRDGEALLLNAVSDYKLAIDGASKIAVRAKGVLESPAPQPDVRTDATDPPLRNRPLPDVAKEFPWLQYGYYALVETRNDESDPWLVGYNDRFFNNMVLDGSWIRNADTEPLRANYIVFSVTPHQLRQDASILAAASDASLKLLDELRRSNGEVSKTIGSLQAVVDGLALDLLQSRADGIARDIVKRVADRDERVKLFQKDFDLAWRSATAGIGNDFTEARRGALLKRAHAIGNETAGRWVERMRRDVLRFIDPGSEEK